MIEPIGEADQVEQLGDVRPLAAERLAVDEHRQPDVFSRGEGWEQVVELEDEADLAAAQAGELVVAQLGERLVVEVDLAGGRDIQPAKQVEQGGLAGAGWPHDGDEFAALNGKINGIEGGDGDFAHAVGFSQ